MLTEARRDSRKPVCRSSQENRLEMYRRERPMPCCPTGPVTKVMRRSKIGTECKTVDDS